MKSALSQREYLNWRKYWAAEPWGPYRDNLHAAIVAREVRRPQLAKGARKPEIDDFMVSDPRERKRKATANFLNLLRVIAKPGKANGN